jgi:hypothetical protein
MSIPLPDISPKAVSQQPYRHDYVLLPACFILLLVALLLVAGAVFGEPVKQAASSACRFQLGRERSRCLMLAGKQPSQGMRAFAPDAGATPYQTVASGAPARRIAIGCEQPVRFQDPVGFDPAHRDGLANASPSTYDAEDGVRGAVVADAAQDTAVVGAMRDMDPAGPVHSWTATSSNSSTSQVTGGDRVVFMVNEKAQRIGYRLRAERLVQQLLDAALPTFTPCASPAPEATATQSQAG